MSESTPAAREPEPDVERLARLAYEADVDGYWRHMGGPRIEPNWGALGPLRQSVWRHTVHKLVEAIAARTPPPPGGPETVGVPADTLRSWRVLAASIGDDCFGIENADDIREWANELEEAIDAALAAAEREPGDGANED